jgi:hypothetical protein
MTLCITVDVDWAEDFALEYTLQLLSDHAATATIFATHQTSVLDGVDDDGFEVGIHPEVDAGHQEPIKNLLEMFPTAVGIRTHRLTDTAALRSFAFESGLQYDSNLYLPIRTPPFIDFSGLVRVPFVWSDYAVIATGGDFDTGWNIPPDLLWVIAVHPIHIYLNTESVDRYKTAAAYRHDQGALMTSRNRGPNPGAADALLALLEQCESGADFILGRDIAALPPLPAVLDTSKPR